MPLDDSEIESLSRRRLLTVAGGSAAVGLAGCSALTDDGDDEEEDGDGGDADGDTGGDTGGDGDGGDGDGDGGDENGGEEEDPRSLDVANAQKAQDAWEAITENPGPDAEDLRTESYVEMEEAIRDDMVMLPLFHNLEERFWWDYVDVPFTGALGSYNQKHVNTSVEGDSELNLIAGTFDEFDPIMSTDTESGRTIRQMMEGLTVYPNGIAEVENDLLADYELSDDGLTYTFTLQEGIQFHNGEEVTASDVKYSWRRAVESEFAERANFVLDSPNGLGLDHSMAEGTEGAGEDGTGLTVVDDYTLEMTVRNPNPDVLDILTYSCFYVIPEGFVGDVEGYEGEVGHDEFRTETVVGTGPFTLDAFTAGEEARVEVFEDYHGTEPDVDSIHWEIIEGSEAEWTYGAVEGNADIFLVPTSYYEPDTINTEEDDRGRQVGTYGPGENLDEEVNYQAVSELATYYFGLNANNVPKAGRQAFAYVTNHEELVNEVFAGRGTEAFSFLPPGMWPTGTDGYNDWVDSWPYGVNETDIESASAVLEEAGYSDSDPLSINLTTYQDETFIQAAELTREKLAGTPIDISLEQAPFTTLQDRGDDGDLQAYSLGWTWSWVSPAYGMFYFEPENTNSENMPNEANGAYLDWQVDLE